MGISRKLTQGLAFVCLGLIPSTLAMQVTLDSIRNGKVTLDYHVAEQQAVRESGLELRPVAVDGQPSGVATFSVPSVHMHGIYVHFQEVDGVLTIHLGRDSNELGDAEENVIKPIF